jgi:RNA polymerase sigma-70 factor (ECF subfamily)
MNTALPEVITADEKAAGIGSAASSAKSDEELAELGLGGDEAACEELVGRYSRSVYNYVARLIGRQEEARDATQETFIKAFRSLSSFNPQNKFKSWLFRIAHNHCIDILRRRKPTLSLDVVQEDDDQRAPGIQLADGGADPERRLLASETGEWLQKALEKLPKAYKEVIILRHFQELSYQEIAEILKLPIGTVKTNIFRAREQMRKQVAEWGAI